MNTELSIESKSRSEFINITDKVQNAVNKSGIKDGDYIFLNLSLFYLLNSLREESIALCSERKYCSSAFRIPISIASLTAGSTNIRR